MLGEMMDRLITGRETQYLILGEILDDIFGKVFGNILGHLTRA